ncbi:MAG: peptidyl-prolyl cis-trans isomerase [bacterium]|nr:peptidyl-prolyl cis-trans isomerase [bacterium]
MAPRFRATLGALLFAAVLSTVAAASSESPIVSKDGSTYKLEDVSLYYLRNLGKDGLLDFLQTMVIYQEGVKLGLKPTTAERTDFIDKKMGRDVYDSFLQLFSKGGVDSLVDYSIVESKYYKTLRDKIKKEKNYTISEKEAREYFTSHIADFHLPEGAFLSIISVDSQAKADGIVARLAGGEDFRKVAGEVNMDPKMRAVRGEIGVYRKGDGLPKELETAALVLKKGEYTKKPVKGTNFHLLFAHEKYAEVTPTFDDVKELLMSDMLEAKIDPLFEAELNKLMAREMPRYTIQAELFKPQDKPAAAVKPAGAKPGATKPAQPQ